MAGSTTSSAQRPSYTTSKSDPGETNNIAAEQPATVAVLREKLQQFLRQQSVRSAKCGRRELSPDAQEKLRALGYFGFRAAVSPEALKQGLADPKDKLWEFNSILKAQDAFQLQRGRPGGGAARQKCRRRIRRSM